MAESLQKVEEAHALLADGRTVRIRPAGVGDHQRVRSLYEQMSAENLRSRFFGAGSRLGRVAADQVCGPARPGCLALLAFHGDDLVGVAEYEGGADTSTAEVALAISDDFHHCGVGTLLLEHLVEAARERRVSSFTADALADNHAVLKVFTDLGLRVERRFEGSEVHCVVHLGPDERYLDAVDRRGRSAQVASLSPLLRPAAVAVAGAGRSADSVGRAVLRNLHRSGFNGPVYAVNPHADSVEGVQCYASVTELPEVPHLAVLAVPAASVPTVARECGRIGVRALVVLASDLDADQAVALLATCRRFDIRLVGPNCLGILNTEDRIRLDATFTARPPAAGAAGVAVQSGGVGIALLGELSRLGVGVSSFVSLGDKYDVSGNDMLQWWEEDDRTRLALLHLESFGNPRAFSRTARRVARTMPVLTVDAGRSVAGRRAAASHTAAAATPTMTRQALFQQAGVTATRTLGDLTGTAALLHSQPLPAGPRVAVVANAGGVGVLAADACAEAGLTVPPLPAEVAGRLQKVLPRGAAAANPVDTTAAVGDTALSECMARLTQCPDVDTLLVVLVPTATTQAHGDLMLALTRGLSPMKRPVVAVLPDQPERVRLLRTSDGGAVPAFADAQDAARALAHASERARWLARQQGTVPELSGTDAPRACAVADGYLATHPAGGWLDPPGCAALLDCFGIPRVPETWASTEEQAVEAAHRLRPPTGRLALKAHGPELLHKTEHGAVVLDLEGPEAVRAAYRDLTARLGEAASGVTVQPMAGQGIELVAGAITDEVFGPLVLFGLGGTATELLADHAARLAPLTDQDAEDLMEAPRCAPLLSGYRGAPPVDRKGLGELLLRLSALACAVPQIAETDLNPVLARPEGVTVLDSRIRLARPRLPGPGGCWPDAYPRRLRGAPKTAGEEPQATDEGKGER